MNMSFPAGTRVWFWNGSGQPIYGSVTSSTRSADGTVLLTITTDSGQRVSLPASSVAKV
ncbi:hypothetical protein C8R44DRAFT_815954 [Mycena epipterygia]|nr:hypothetical protein C8R44DRAFT_815954 [Mycena epipterygia]